MNKKKIISVSQNRLGDNHFSLRDSERPGTRLIYFDWDCNIEKKIWAQNLFLMTNNVVGRTTTGLIEVRNFEQAQLEASLLKKICCFWEKTLPEKPLWNWNRKDITYLLRNVMIRHVLADENLVLHYNGTLSLYCSLINRSRKAYIEGRLTDGFGFTIDPNFKQQVMTPLVNKTDSTFEEWKAGGTYGSIPPVINSLILSNAINLIESEQTSIAKCFFTAWRRYPITPKYYFKHDPKKTDSLELFYSSKIQNQSTARFLAEELNTAGLSHIRKLPWNTFGEFIEYCQTVETAVMTILLSLSGHRTGELLSIYSTDWDYRNGEMFIKEEIEKTLDSILIPRHFHNLAVSAAKTLWSLSFIDADKYRIPLFHRNYNASAAIIIQRNGDIEKWIKEKSKLTDQTLRTWINKYYQTRILPLNDDLSTIHPRITPHQFRHSWAEFALRRFDYNVTAAIREHFLHKSEFAVRRYTNGKLQESVKYSIQHNYLRELIHRIYGPSPLEDRFIGPAFRRITNELSKLKILYPSEIDSHISSIAGNIESIMAFEWGYCVLFNDSKHDAKCGDRFTGYLNPSERGSPKLCTTCPNQMINPIQQDNLTRIAINHNHIAEAHPIRAIGKISLDIVQQIKRRLEEK